jgi:hypothetical protein
VLSACAAALAAMAAAFLAAVPYSVIDIPAFLNGVGYEVFHYASGHAGFAGEPGLGQFVYYLRHFREDFGYGLALLAVVGLLASPRAGWRRAAVVVAFPAALLWLLSSQRVHFTRNALAIHPFVAMFAALGFVTVHEWAVGIAARRGWAPRIPLPALAALGLAALTLPFWHYAGNLRDRTDSRNQAREWIAAELPPNWTLVVPSELGFDRRGLEAGGRQVKVVDLGTTADPNAVQAMLADVPAPAVILVPRWGADRRSPGQETAKALNAVTEGWRVVRSFGSNDVLVNYTSPTAWGDPAFAVAILR